MYISGIYCIENRKVHPRRLILCNHIEFEAILQTSFFDVFAYYNLHVKTQDYAGEPKK
jgi:hypothetical protein